MSTRKAVKQEEAVKHTSDIHAYPRPTSLYGGRKL